jgi:hypothetical protein
MQEFEARVRAEFAYMSYAPSPSSRPKPASGWTRCFDLINAAYAMSCLRVATGALNEVLRDAVMRVQPPSDRGKRLKVYYITQTDVRPPISSFSATTPSFSTSHTGGIWKTASAPRTAIRARPSGSRSANGTRSPFHSRRGPRFIICRASTAYCGVPAVKSP